MKREDFEKLGLTGETLEKAELPGDLIDKIMALHGKDIETHKSKIETAGRELETVKKQLAEANDQIEKFKGMDIETVKRQAADWEAKAKQFEEAEKQAREDAEARINEIHFMADLTDELKATYKVIDPQDVLPQLKREKIQRGDDGKKFIGLDEQMKPLIESKAYLFASEETTPRIVKGAKSDSVIGDATIEAFRKGANMSEIVK